MVFFVWDAARHLVGDDGEKVDAATFSDALSTYIVTRIRDGGTESKWQCYVHCGREALVFGAAVDFSDANTVRAWREDVCFA